MSILQTSGLQAGARTMLQTTARFLPEPVGSGVGFAGSLMGGMAGTQYVDISPSYQALIERQIQVQLEQQQVTFTSNIERSQHESRMAAVRNLRLG
jgi:hypothetical protein